MVRKAVAATATSYEAPLPLAYYSCASSLLGRRLREVCIISMFISFSYCTFPAIAGISHDETALALLCNCSYEDENAPDSLLISTSLIFKPLSLFFH